jgi:hypothetical protein
MQTPDLTHCIVVPLPQPAAGNVPRNPAVSLPLTGFDQTAQQSNER